MSPGPTAGNRGSVAATATRGSAPADGPAGGVAASSAAAGTSRKVTTCWTSRGAATVSTAPDHGPEPAGNTTSAAGAAEAVARRRAIATAPIEAGSTVLTSPPRHRAAWRPTVAAATARAVASMTRVSARSPGPNRLTTVAPTASQALAVISPRRTRPPANAALDASSTDGQERLQLLERGRSEDLSRPELVDRGEGLLIAGRDDLRRGHRSDPGKLIELSRRRGVQLERRVRASGRRAARRAHSWVRGPIRVVSSGDDDLLAVFHES